MIEDEEYWRGDLARRTPLKRDYLASLLCKLDAADPAVIALDVDFRSQTPDNSYVEHPDYKRETAILSKAIQNIASHRPIVLTKPLFVKHRDGPWFNSDNQVYLPEPSILDPFIRGEAKAGYTLFRRDVRQIPLSLRIADGTQLDSFSAAIVRCVDAGALREARERDSDAVPYGTYINLQGFLRMSSRQVLLSNVDQLRRQLAHLVVIVGGHWHKDMFGKGNFVDLYPTPAGQMSGALIHANYVEALLYSRTYRPWKTWVTLTLETALSLGLAVVFALDFRVSRKFICVAGLSVFMVIFSVISWQNLGLFFDFFIPVILLSAHAIVEEVWEWKSDSQEYRKESNASLQEIA